MHGWQADLKRTCASPVTFRVLPENEIPPRLTGGFLLSTPRTCPHFLHDPAAPSAPPVPASDAACSLLHSPCGANPGRRADFPPQRFCSFSPGLFAKRPTARAAAHRTDPPYRSVCPATIIPAPGNLCHARLRGMQRARRPSRGGGGRALLYNENHAIVAWFN